MRDDAPDSLLRRHAGPVSKHVHHATNGPYPAIARRCHRVHQSNQHRAHRNGRCDFQYVLVCALDAVEFFLVLMSLVCELEN